MPNPTSSVYVICAPELGPGRVKIGYTNRHPSERLADLQTGSPTPLRLLYWTEGNAATERVLHSFFASRRVHGEWFDFGDTDPSVAVAEAVALLRAAVEPYDPNRRMVIPPPDDPAQLRYEDTRDSIISALILRGPMGTRQLGRVLQMPESTVRRDRGRMESEGILTTGKPDRPGGPAPVTLNQDHPAVLALLP